LELKLNIRLWSLHPKYFDFQTLSDLWRDCVRATRLIKDGKAGKYPQLERILKSCRPMQAMTEYMHAVADVAEHKGWEKRWLFDRRVIERPRSRVPLISVTAGQMEFETWHYGELLVKRDGGGQKYVDFWSIREPAPHPIFTVCPGAIEKWEKLSHVDYTQCLDCGGPIYYHGKGQPPTRCEHCRPQRRKA